MSLAGVRGFARGLKILKELNAQRYATVLQLSRAVDLPRSTVYRLLDTLVQEGYVQQLPGDDRYCLKTAVAELSRGLHSELLIAEVAQPVLKDLNHAINWPVLLHSFEGNNLITRQVTRSKRVATNPRLGQSVPLLLSSPGRLSYASLSDSRQAEVRSMLAGAAGRREKVAHKLEALNRLVAEVRRRGCGFRDGGYVPQTCSFAVPITMHEKQEAFITVVFARSVQTLDQAIQNYLPVTRDAAEVIRKRVLDRTQWIQAAQPARISN